MKSLKDLLSAYFVLPFLILIFLATTYYLFQPGFFYVHDFPMGARVVEMAANIKSMNFPPRWSANFGYGFGMPLFSFYAPLPYFLGALIYLLGFQLTATLKILYLFLTFLSLISSYKLGKLLGNKLTGVLLAALFVLAPYRALNLFVRGALSEVFAMSFFPLVFLAIEKLRLKFNKNNAILLIISLAAIVLSHNLSALMFVPLALIYALMRIKKQHRLKILFAFIISFFLTAFYTVPSFIEKDLTKVARIFEDYFDYRNHFLYIRQFFHNDWGYGGSAWGTNDDISFFLGWTQLVGLALIIFLGFKELIFIVKSKKIIFKPFLLAAFFLALSLFMSIEKSHWVWEKIDLLSYIQFPWRWLGSASFFLALASSLSLQGVKNKILRFSISIFLILLSFFNLGFFKAQKILSDPEKYYYNDPQKISGQMSLTLSDYIPVQMAKDEVLAEFNQNYPGVNLWSENSSSLKSIQLINKRSHYQHWFLDLTEETLINFKIAYFPDWQLKIDGQRVDYQINPDLGNIQFLTPPGKHHLEIKFIENGLRKTFNLISFLTLFFIVYYLKKDCSQDEK